jgi:sugar/nucleoside kinase (ribokinase family)
VSFVGDEDAATVAALLDAAGVDRSSIVVLPGASGTFVFPTQADDRHPWPMYRPAEAAPHTTAHPPVRADVVLVFGMPDFDALAAGWVAPGPQDVLVWDRQGFLSRTRDCRPAAALAPQRKIYLANLEEALEEFPAETTEETLTQLPPTGFAAAVIKRGPDGCLVIDRCNSIAVSGFPVDARSTIGSGDAFAGALAAGIDAGLALDEAAWRGNAAAAAFLEFDDPIDARLPERAGALVAARTPPSSAKP